MAGVNDDGKWVVAGGPKVPEVPKGLVRLVLEASVMVPIFVCVAAVLVMIAVGF